MNILCTIILTLNAGGVNIITNSDVKGTVLFESETRYVVDFSKGLEKYNISGKSSDYSEVLVDKTSCVKLK